jgi:splicing factor 3B subunit 1
MNPPVKDLCEWNSWLRTNRANVGFVSVPRMTPNLRNRHEKVQEASINFIGECYYSVYEYRVLTCNLADRCAEFMPAREWMRIPFELFGHSSCRCKLLWLYYHKFRSSKCALGPANEFASSRASEPSVCSTVAIVIVAEICGRELVFNFHISHC